MPEEKPGPRLDFATFARLAAAAIVLLAGAYLYFFARP
jgi:hypothetical protein